MPGYCSHTQQHVSNSVHAVYHTHHGLSLHSRSSLNVYSHLTSEKRSYP